MNAIRVGIGKGRAAPEAFRLFEQAGVLVPPAFREGRQLVVTGQGLTLVRARDRDMPTLLLGGHIDVAVASSAWFVEVSNPALKCQAYLDCGLCRLSVLRSEASRDLPIRKVSTRFVGLAKLHLPGTDIVELSGCNEICIALGFADTVLDVVETGATIREMRLLEVKVITEFQHSVWVRSNDPAAWHEFAERFPTIASSKR